MGEWPDDPSHPDSVPVQDFLDELRDRFQRVDMVWGPINLVVTPDPEFVVGILDRVPDAPPAPSDSLRVEPLRLSLGGGLERVMHELPAWYPELQRHARLKLGVEVPELMLWCDPGLPDQSWTIDLFEEVTARGQTQTERLLARASEPTLAELRGPDTVDGPLGLWIPPELEERARQLGCKVIDVVVAAILVQIHQILLRRSGDLLTLQQVHRMVAEVARTDPLVVEELIPARLSWAGLQEVLQSLLREQVSVRELRRILEVLLRTVPLTSRPDTLTEYVRCDLCRGICRRLQRQGRLHVIVPAPELEAELFASSQSTELGRMLGIDSQRAQQVLEQVHAAQAVFGPRDLPPVMMTSPRVRPLFRRLIERSFPALAVLSWNEVPPGLSVVELGGVG